MTTELASTSSGVPRTNDGDLCFTGDLAFAMYIGAWYCAGGMGVQDMPRYGADLQGQCPTTREGNQSVRWSVAKTTEDYKGERVVGLRIVKHYGPDDGGKRKDVYWCPLTAFKTATLIVEGVVVTEGE